MITTRSHRRSIDDHDKKSAVYKPPFAIQYGVDNKKTRQNKQRSRDRIGTSFVYVYFQIRDRRRGQDIFYTARQKSHW